jgi:hypothetical protein
VEKCGVVWAVGPQSWHDRDEQVGHDGNRDPPNYSAERDVIEIGQIYQKAREEQEQGDVYQWG